jgi:PPM family protein phosphatase
LAKSIALALLQQGTVRRHNEDNVYILDRLAQAGQSQFFEHSAVSSDSPQFYAVADGTGGGGIGDLASRTVMQVLDRQRRAINPGSRFDFANFARDTVDMANRAVCEQLASFEGLAIGTTFSLLAIEQDTAYTISLGDSRIYLFRDGQLQCLTTDHISQMPDFHQMAGHVGFLTDSAIVESDNMTRTALVRGDVFLLLTDGVTDILTDEQIQAALNEPVAFVQQIQNLRERTLQLGSRDNLSLIGVKIQDPHAAAPVQTKKKDRDRRGSRRSARQLAARQAAARAAGRGEAAADSANRPQGRPRPGGIWPGGLIPAWMRFILFFLLFVLLGIALGKVIFSLPAWLAWLNKLIGS